MNHKIQRIVEGFFNKPTQQKPQPLINRRVISDEALKRIVELTFDGKASDGTYNYGWSVSNGEVKLYDISRRNCTDAFVTLVVSQLVKFSELCRKEFGDFPVTLTPGTGGHWQELNYCPGEDCIPDDIDLCNIETDLTDCHISIYGSKQTITARNSQKFIEWICRNNAEHIYMSGSAHDLDFTMATRKFKSFVMGGSAMFIKNISLGNVQYMGILHWRILPQITNIAANSCDIAYFSRNDAQQSSIELRWMNGLNTNAIYGEINCKCKSDKWHSLDATDVPIFNDIDQLKIPEKFGLQLTVRTNAVYRDDQFSASGILEATKLTELINSRGFMQCSGCRYNNFTHAMETQRMPILQIYCIGDYKDSSWSYRASGPKKFKAAVETGEYRITGSKYYG